MLSHKHARNKQFIITNKNVTVIKSIHQDIYSLISKTSYHHISGIFVPTRLDAKLVKSLWYLTGAWVVLLQGCQFQTSGRPNISRGYKMSRDLMISSLTAWGIAQGTVAFLPNYGKFPVIAQGRLGLSELLYIYMSVSYRTFLPICSHCINDKYQQEQVQCHGDYEEAAVGVGILISPTTRKMFYLYTPWAVCIVDYNVWCFSDVLHFRNWHHNWPSKQLKKAKYRLLCRL